MPDVDSAASAVLQKLDEILDWPKNKIEIKSGFGNDYTDGRQLKFTGQIYLYTASPLSDGVRSNLDVWAKDSGFRLTYRSIEYQMERNKWESPRAFISHDSRDKEGIAEPIALQLQQLMCPVWYDQFSLRIGDSLRESIEMGLKECHKCILILTPNFLENTGWARREYDSVFTRELVEKKKLILPVWHDVAVEDVYEFSPILADRVGAQWGDGVDKVVRRLKNAIDT